MHMPGKRATGKAHMAAMGRLPQCDMLAHLAMLRQAASGHKGIVFGVQSKGRDLYVCHAGLG